MRCVHWPLRWGGSTFDLHGIQMLTTVNSFEAIAGRDASSTKSAARGLLRTCLA